MPRMFFTMILVPRMHGLPPQICGSTRCVLGWSPRASSLICGEPTRQITKPHERIRHTPQGILRCGDARSLRPGGGDAPRRGPRIGRKTVMKVTGVWRIVEMDLWDAEAIDLVGPG